MCVAITEVWQKSVAMSVLILLQEAALSCVIGRYCFPPPPRGVHVFFNESLFVEEKKEGLLLKKMDLGGGEGGRTL